MRGPRGKPTILKLIAGAAHPERFRDDVRTPPAAPVLPPGVELSEQEKQLWDWLTAHATIAHTSVDGLALLNLVRLASRALTLDAKISEQGVLMRDPQRKRPPTLSPYARHSLALRREVRLGCADLGLTPPARWRCGAPYAPRSDASSDWDAIN